MHPVLPARFVEIRVISSVLTIVTTIQTAVNNSYLMPSLSLFFFLSIEKLKFFYTATIMLHLATPPAINYNCPEGNLSSNFVSSILLYLPFFIELMPPFCAAASAFLPSFLPFFFPFFRRTINDPRCFFQRYLARIFINFGKERGKFSFF